MQVSSPNESESANLKRRNTSSKPCRYSDTQHVRSGHTKQRPRRRSSGWLGEVERDRPGDPRLEQEVGPHCTAPHAPTIRVPDHSPRDLPTRPHSRCTQRTGFNHTFRYRHRRRLRRDMDAGILDHAPGGWTLWIRENATTITEVENAVFDEAYEDPSGGITAPREAHRLGRSTFETW